MTSLRFTVATHDLRAGLKAVLPHHDPGDFPPLHRIHVEVDDVNVTLSATNRYTAGIALVSVEDPSGDQHTFDLSPKDVRDVLSQFHGKPGKDEDDPGELLRIDLDSKHVRFTDCSGLFDGKALRLLRYADETNFPKVGKLVAGMLARPVTTEAAKRLSVQGRYVALFKAAAEAYGESLVLEPTGANGSLVVSCGESFIGALMPVRHDEVGTAKLDEWRAAWVRRLPWVGVQDELETLPDPDEPDHDETAEEQVGGEVGVQTTTVEVLPGGTPVASVPPPSFSDRPDHDPERALLREAAVIVINKQFASMSMLQRKLRISQGKARTVMGQLEEQGIVGPGDGTKARDVLVETKDIQQVLRSLEPEPAAP